MQSEVVSLPTKLNILVKKVFSEELPALTEQEDKDLRKSIERDGVLDSLKYWVNPKTKHLELLDGHNRKRIADELGLDYQLQQINVSTQTEALYWMRRNQSARRGGGRNLARMSQLWQMIQEERKQPVSQHAADKKVAQDTGAHIRTIERQREQQKAEEPVEVPPTKSGPLERAIRAVTRLDREAGPKFDEWYMKHREV